MMNTIWNSFFELFFPRLCVSCKQLLIKQEKHLCLNCMLEIPKTNHLKEVNNELEIFFSGRFPFENMASFAYYVKGSVLQRIIHQIKYRSNHKLAILMGELCGKEMVENGRDRFVDIDYIVPIPLHPKRLKKRGYNQSLALSEGISSRTGIMVNDGNLIRIINNPSQTKNSRFERWQNTEGIFDIKNKTIYKNKHILLIDDVVTTGSTLEICAKLLLSCENCRVSIYTLGSAI